MNFNFNFENRGLDFVKHRRKYFAISAILIGLGMLILLFLGLKLGVDFEGGTRLEIMHDERSFTEAEITQILTEMGHVPGEVRLAGNNNEIAATLFVGTKTPDEVTAIRGEFESKYGQEHVTISESTVSPTIARELAEKAVYAVILASIGIVIYVTIRFEYRFAIAAVIALFHDALFIIALFSILRLEVDLTFIAAVLTIVGYSINDTIVIFDRIRENLKFAKVKNTDDLSDIVNRSIVETLPRSINTSLTVVFAALFLFLLGGEGIRNFSFALLVGLVAGTYSSIFIAAQIWIVLKAQEVKKKMYNTQAES